jgi:hypothetical protein
MLGSETDARRTLEGFVADAGMQPTSSSFAQSPYRQAKRRLAESDPGSAAEPEDGHLFAKSEFFRTSLPEQSVAALADHIGAARVPGQARELDFTPWGGAYNRVRPDATAFAHRRERFLLKDAQAAAACCDVSRRSRKLPHSGVRGARACCRILRSPASIALPRARRRRWCRRDSRAGFGSVAVSSKLTASVSSGGPFTRRRPLMFVGHSLPVSAGENQRPSRRSERSTTSPWGLCAGPASLALSRSP